MVRSHPFLLSLWAPDNVWSSRYSVTDLMFREHVPSAKTRLVVSNSEPNKLLPEDRATASPDDSRIRFAYNRTTTARHKRIETVARSAEATSPLGPQSLSGAADPSETQPLATSPTPIAQSVPCANLGNPDRSKFRLVAIPPYQRNIANNRITVSSGIRCDTMNLCFIPRTSGNAQSISIST